MTRTRLTKLLLMNLNQELEENDPSFCTKEEAYQILKDLTKEDFGYDVEKWKRWIRETKFPEGCSKNRPHAQS